MDQTVRTNKPGQVITFYSYKGGVGRSMALANVACLLAQTGQKVLVVDWDLEAPGLHRFFHDQLTGHFGVSKVTEQMLDQQPGLIDLFIELDAATQHPSLPQGTDIAREVINQIDFDKYLLKTNLPTLTLLKAGRQDEGYGARITTFSWENLFNRSPYLYRSLAEHWAEEYEYVLIDSRTGETDTSGICTMIMPEKLVAVFSPNRQSLIGVRNISERALRYRRQSDDLRNLTIFPLPSRIEISEPGLREKWRKNEEFSYQPIFEELFKSAYKLENCDLDRYFDEVQIQHYPRYSYGEEIAVVIESSDDRLSINRSYRDFTNILVNRRLPWGESELYVFISYATPDRVAAEKIEAFLVASGIRVFRDSNILPGDNWDITIDQALRDCQCMVLLLSQASMPENQEVYREWFSFAQEQKPIYPLLIQDCELHFRFSSRTYIDARPDLAAALKRLLDDIGRNFDLADAATDPEKIDLLVPDDHEEDGLRSSDQAHAITDNELDPLTVYRHERIAEWSLPRYELDHRFVNLTLTLDRPEDKQQRWHPVAEPPMRDLREVLAKAKDHQALVLIGAPGSGKSTLLRRLQLDHSQDRIDDGGEQVSFFIQLNEHRAEQPPSEWLATAWKKRYPQMPPLEKLLATGRMLLLLDALNEMQPRKGSYAELIAEWKAFVQQSVQTKNRLVFSCRSRDIGAAQLGSKELPVPLIDVQPMTADQMQDFLKAYSPEHHERIWKELKGSKQFDLFQTPYFLKLLCEQVGASGDLPKGRAGLFTGFVRRVLDREKDGELFQAGALLSARDRQKMASGRDWRDEFDLPQNGKLIPKLSQLAFDMQKDGSEVSLDYDEACRLLDDQQSEQILKAGIELNLLDEARDSIKFFHQSLQEYFAARLLAKQPNSALVRVEWSADKVPEPLAETIAGLSDGDPLPPLEQTGWEETTLTAAAMAKDQAGFVRSLVTENLALAARCAASAEVKISEELKQEIRWALVERTKDKTADLRARIAAGEALGLLGDPRFQSGSGEFGKYLFPPLVKIPGGKYTIGDDKSDYDFEKPAGEVQLDDFQIGQFPVTNAEYKLFIEAGGYEDERWWNTPESLAWLSGEAVAEGQKEDLHEIRKALQGYSEDYILGLVTQNRITSQQAEDWIAWRTWTDEYFVQQLEEWLPTGKLYRQPEYWEDARFNNPAQPTVGVTWFEALAYCNWLTANAADGRIFRLPTEAEFEAAARGKKGRQFPYGKTFDSAKCNTFESHIRRTTPVGVFDNATPEGAFDLSGNAYTWTLSIYDQDRFPFPYRSDDGREDISATGVRRVMRGGSWAGNRMFALVVSRSVILPGARLNSFGFRVVSCRPPLLTDQGRSS